MRSIRKVTLYGLAMAVTAFTAFSGTGAAFASPSHAPPVTGHAHSANRAPHILLDYTNICLVYLTTDFCLRDPSSGGDGTKVKIGLFSTDTAEQFDPVTDTSRCGGFVTTSGGGCPFSSPDMNADYAGNRIVVLKQAGSLKCIRDASEVVQMGTCDTGNEPSSAFIFHVECGGSCNTYISVTASDLVGGFPDYLASDGKIDDLALFDVHDTNLTQFYCNGVC